MLLYSGPLNRAKMDLPTRRAYKSWVDQRQRCNNPKDPRFYSYGAKGIKQEYSSREFITWYLVEYSKRESWNRPQCGRIDHSKNYTLDNIELCECSDNVKERNKRLGNPMASIAIAFKNIKTGEIKSFTSKREAARILGVPRNIKQLRSTKNPKNGWILIE